MHHLIMQSLREALMPDTDSHIHLWSEQPSIALRARSRVGHVKYCGLDKRSASRHTFSLSIPINNRPCDDPKWNALCRGRSRLPDTAGWLAGC